jgi:geranylgeranyl pyrophosphate synthase
MRLGLAFQIADDILDVTQTTATTGKDAGNDLQNGRLTLPVLRALACATTSADPTELKQLQQWLRGERDYSRSEFLSLNAVSSGIESALSTASQLVQRSFRDLQTFPDSTERQLLEHIAAFSIRREQ